MTDGEELAQAKAQIETLKDALHRDQTGLAHAINEIRSIAEGYSWVATSRGCYQWDDDEYRKEMGRMLDHIINKATKALKESGKRAHAHCCPK